MQKGAALSKIYNDPIHGHIEIDPVCQAIIDTPHFQQLRYIKQLGMGYFVFPGASHNLFEHALGTCYLAGEFARTLKINQPYLGITDDDILCVQIAGLCHCLGKLEDPRFQVNGKQCQATEKEIELSIEKFDKLIKYIKDLSLSPSDVTFIKDIIRGKQQDSKDRGKFKGYLYEIVCNKGSQIDAGRMDSVARDCHHIGIKNSFDYRMYINSVKVIPDEDQFRICIKDKKIDMLNSFFFIRFDLQKNYYQNKVKRSIELMVKTALEIDGFIDDWDPFSGDILMSLLYYSIDKPEMKKAKRLINRLFWRKHCSCVYESRLTIEELQTLGIAHMRLAAKLETSKQRAELYLRETSFQDFEIKINKVKQLIKDKNINISDNGIIVDIARFDVGLNDHGVCFYKYLKNTPNQAIKLEDMERDKILGKKRELVVRIYCLDLITPDEKATIQQWCKEVFQPRVSSHKQISTTPELELKLWNSWPDEKLKTYFQRKDVCEDAIDKLLPLLKKKHPPEHQSGTEKLPSEHQSGTDNLLSEHQSGLTMNDIADKEIGLKDAFKICNCLDELLTANKNSPKLMLDPIHGYIEINKMCEAIIDTPFFQRLRFIKQLGTCYLVFPGAAHNRFEHSLGVYHLAGKFARTLRENQPKLKITDTDILCVEIAGLCHDLGHVPFSYALLDALDIRDKHQINKNKASVEVFECIIQRLQKKYHPNEKGGLSFGDNHLSSTDLEFIKEMIGGPLKITGSTDWPYTGRDEKKAYLYEIVFNQRNGVDVNVWDYMARDCHHLGFKNSFNIQRYMTFARVLEVDGELQICIKESEVNNVYNMFYTRLMLFKYAYHHPVTAALELMLVDAFRECQGILQVKQLTFEIVPKTLADCLKSKDHYDKLNDHLLFLMYDGMKEDNDDRSKKTLNILKRIFERNLYQCVFESQPFIFKQLSINLTDIKNGIEKDLVKDIANLDFEVKVYNFDFGMRDENPVSRLKVYTKRAAQEARGFTKDEMCPLLMPETFNEKIFRVYNKGDKEHNDKIREAAKRYFHDWKQDLLAEGKKR